MEIFIFWAVLIIGVVGGYSYYLVRHSPKGFRLQIKLTIIFMLLVLLPTIPLLFMVSGLLTQGVEMFLLPGVEQSLAQSLQVIKLQMEEKGHHFFEHHPNFSKIDADELLRFGILYAGQFQYSSGIFLSVVEIATHPEIHPHITEETMALIFDEGIKSRVISHDKNQICEVFLQISPSNVNIIGYPINDVIIEAKDNIEKSLRVYTSLSLLKKSVIEGRLIWGAATLLVIILAILAIHAARILSRGISEPIQQLAIGMQNVAAGDLSSKVTVPAKDELKILVDSFNKMADDLKISQEKLVIAERFAAWRDVARRISHEIRNSLTPIQISLHRIKTKYMNGDQFDEDEPVVAIQDEIESLRRISEEFSQFARMPQVQRVENNINEIIHALIPLIEGGSKPIKLVRDLEVSLPRILIDRDQIKRVLNNLLKNSVEASSVGGTIYIKTKTCNDNANKILIEIKDEGHGMSADVLEKIFEPYFTTKKRGMGLGLSIVKRIIEDHDGTITVESQERKGTTVSIIL